MLKKTMFVAGAAAALMMVGGTAFAGEGYAGGESDETVGLVNTGDILSDNAVNVCHNNVNVLGVQVTDVLNGLSANLPILNNKPASASEGTNAENCVAGVVSSDDHSVVQIHHPCPGLVMLSGTGSDRAPCPA